MEASSGEALTRLAHSPQGLTAPELADLSWGHDKANRTSATLHALKLLQERGLAATTGRVPRPREEGRGAWPYRWVITEAGRELVTTALEVTP